MSLHSADVTHRLRSGTCSFSFIYFIYFRTYLHSSLCHFFFCLCYALSASCRHNKLKTIKQLLTSQRHLEINNTCLKFLAVGFMNSFEVFVSVDNFLQYLQWGLTDIRRRELMPHSFLCQMNAMS